MRYYIHDSRLHQDLNGAVSFCICTTAEEPLEFEMHWIKLEISFCSIKSGCKTQNLPRSWDLNEQCGLNVLRCNSFCHQGTMAFPSQIWGKGHQKLRWDWKNTGYKNHFVAKNCNCHLFKLSVMESISLHLLVLHSSLAAAIPMLDNGMGEKVSSSASYHHIHQNYHCHK